MKCLVTGGLGFIGSNLVDELINLGHEVVVIDKNSDSNYFNDKAIYRFDDVCDINNTIDAYQGVDVVFHLAAKTRIKNSLKDPLEYIRVNSLGTSVALECSRLNNVKRFIYSSTSSIYGNNNIPNKESDENDYLNPYSFSKKNGEDLCNLYAKNYNLNTISLRYFNVYGNRQPSSSHDGLLLGIFSKQKKENLQLTIVGDGSQKKDFTNVEDVVFANLLFAFSDIDKKYFGDVFNIGSGVNHSVSEIASYFNVDTINIEKRDFEVSLSLADVSKAKQAVGWEPKHNLIDWLIKNA
jgi:UDP-glucose 4-epimerase